MMQWWSLSEIKRKRQELAKVEWWMFYPILALMVIFDLLKMITPIITVLVLVQFICKYIS